MDSNINRNITTNKKEKLPPDWDDLLIKIKSGDLIAVSRAITLVENKNYRFNAKMLSFLSKLPSNHNSLRIAITGPPGAGKSTFIEACGMELIARGLKVAVIAIDPASEKSKGSILGDKTRMTDLSQSPRAFIRPSSNILEKGGIRSSVRHSLRICEVAGYDIIFLETVGVGQSEIEAGKVTDLTLLLLTPTGGDELQGIKKGIVENADFILVNKADGINKRAAEQTARNYKNALHLQRKSTRLLGKVNVSTVSALEKTGISELADKLYALKSDIELRSKIEYQRTSQDGKWISAEARAIMMHHLESNPFISSLLGKMGSAGASLEDLLSLNIELKEKLKKL